MVTKRYLTASEVAAMLQLNVETVYSLIAKEQLPAVKVGGQWRFDEQGMTGWIAANSVNQQTAIRSDHSVNA